MINTLHDINNEWSWILHEEMYFDALQARRLAGSDFIEDFLLDFDLQPGEIHEIGKLTQVLTRPIVS